MQLAQFLEFAQEGHGDTLRAVEWYRDDEAELIYLRDDLDLEEVQRRADEVHKNLTGVAESSEGQELDDLGDELATMSLRDDAVLVHLPVNPNYGVVFSLDTAAARSLHQFINECRETLIEHGPIE